MNDQMDYKEMMALRCAYNHGVKTPETRAAACLYIQLRRKGKIEQFKVESMIENKNQSDMKTLKKSENEGWDL
ncbi:hypothetical protein [Acinetobacter baumannii]|uniref:hypothetical protein n=1 Tax=Acinetobacter baumannii TaxID=470 RepID=UPI0022B552E4|nr:hypothetical protein [Acinetobacter baumannii]MCZ6920287.1 hypothetical protein [Acinetobacter baumannii]